MAKKSSSKKREKSKARTHKSATKGAGKASLEEDMGLKIDPILAEKQDMVEKLFRHTNQFLEDNKHDPLLVVEALASILVRYAALLGPVEQMKDRLEVVERMIGLESAQIQKIAQAEAAKNPPK